MGLAQTAEITLARKAFHQAAIDEQKSQEFHALFSQLNQASPTLTAYEAVAEAMVARVEWSPFAKLSQVRKYQKKMIKAVKEDPDNIEIRFLRLAIEYNLPAFLGMSEHLKEDLEMILQNLSAVAEINFDPAYGQYIFYFLKSTELCTKDEILAMQASLKPAPVF